MRKVSCGWWCASALCARARSSPLYLLAQAYTKDGAVCDKIMYGLLRDDRAALPPASAITRDGVTWVTLPPSPGGHGDGSAAGGSASTPER